MTRNLSTPLQRLQKRLPPGQLRLEPEICARYAGDKWFASALPDAVALPSKTENIADILKFASKNKIPVTPRGAGYGYVGGCVPVRGGIVLSLERMNRIKEINPEDFVAVVEPGVHTATLQEAVETAREIGAQTTYLTHLTHRVTHRELLEKLPPGVLPAFDGLEINLAES